MNHSEMEASLEFMPKLKQLLENYVLSEYQADAKLDKWHLVEEYFHLKRNNNIHLLFAQELLDKTGSTKGAEWL